MTRDTIPARGANAPEGDLGFHDKEAMRRGRLQTRTRPDDTVHILDPAALSTDQMVMVVPDACFIERGGVRRFDTPHQSGLQKGMEVVVNSLARESAKAFPGDDRDIIGIHMPTAMDRGQHREPGRGNPHPDLAQFFFDYFRVGCHVIMITHSLDFVNIWTMSGN